MNLVGTNKCMDMIDSYISFHRDTDNIMIISQVVDKLVDYNGYAYVSGGNLKDKITAYRWNKRLKKMNRYVDLQTFFNALVLKDHTLVEKIYEVSGKEKEELISKIKDFYIKLFGEDEVKIIEADI